MLFDTNLGLVALATLLSLVGLGHADDCIDAPSVSGTFVGVGFSDDKKNLYNCDTKWKDGLVVSGMEVWSSEWQVKGIRLTYSDGSRSPIRGQTDSLNQWGSTVSGKPGPPPDNGYGWDKIEWGAGKIDKVRLWVNYNDGQGPNAVGRVQVWPTGADNDKKRILDVGSNVGGDTGGMNVENLGSGVLIGVRTQSGAFLDTLEFVFMDGKVESAETINIEWPESIEDLNKKQDSIKRINVEDSWIKNSNPVGGQKQGWTFGSGQQKTQERIITHQNTAIVGGDVSVSISAEVDIPAIAKLSSTVTAGVHWESQSMQSTSNRDTTTYEMKIDQSSTDQGPLEPQHAVHCIVDTFTSNYNSEFTATVRMTMSSGKTYDIKQPGKLVSVLYTKKIQDCKTVALHTVPEGAQVLEDAPYHWDIHGSESATSTSAVPATSAILKRALIFRG